MLFIHRFVTINKKNEKNNFQIQILTLSDAFHEDVKFGVRHFQCH
jgi:hypothetical protein